MPLQTRRQAATSSPGGTSDDPTSQQVDDRIQGEVEETPNKQQRRSAQHAQHIKSSPPSSSHHHHPQHPNDSPEYDSRERVERVGPPSSASRHSGGWHERGGPSGADRPYPPAGGGQEQLYSSPPFKVRYDKTKKIYSVLQMRSIGLPWLDIMFTGCIVYVRVMSQVVMWNGGPVCDVV